MDEPQAQTRPIDPTDPSYIRWVSTSGQGITMVPPPSPPADPRADEISGRTTSLEATAGLSTLFAYRNYRPQVDWNTCGQAAIATLLDFHGKDPYGLPRPQHGNDGRDHWDDGAIIDSIKQNGFGPDAVFGWGTTGGRMVDALRAYGIPSSLGYWTFWPQTYLMQIQELLWSELKNQISRGLPVPVLIDVGDLGASWYTAHWPVVYRIEDDKVYLGNCSWKPVISKQQFLYVWRCWFLPYGFNYCCVLTQL